MQTINLSIWDLSVFILYIIFLLYLGYRASNKTQYQKEDDYLLANRSLTLPAFVATLVTTWYGGILGIGEFTYLHGISTWFIFGLPYYFFALLFAVIFAGKIRKRNLYTIPDVLYTVYGRKVGLFGSLILVIMTSPAPYILMVGYLMQWVFGFPFIVSLILGTLFSTIYIFFGGFRSIVKTDIFQFILMFLGFGVLLFFLFRNYGGWTFLHNTLDPSYFIWNGSLSWQYILVWFFLASWTIIDPGFHQRCSAAVSPEKARTGIFISICFWLIFDLLTVSSGLYAAALLKDITPVMAYPTLGDIILPPVIKGLFFTGLFAIIMSTIDSFSFLSAITIGRDIFRKGNNNEHTAGFTRAGLIITAVLAVLLAWLFPSVIELWYIIGSLTIPPMLLPLVTAYFKRFALTPQKTILVMGISFMISFSAFVYGICNRSDGNIQYFLDMEPFFPGFLFSFGYYGLFNSLKFFRVYGRQK